MICCHIGYIEIQKKIKMKKNEKIWKGYDKDEK